jgi:hypothetical protein
MSGYYDYNYSYDFNDFNYDDLKIIIPFLIAIFSIVFLFAAATYIINAAALYRMAKKCSIENAWLAWIPIGNAYILGKVVGPFKCIVDISNPEIV